MIYIECDADEVLIKELGFNRKQFIHEGGKFEICNRLQKTTNSIGLIEHDSGQSNPPYFNRFSLYEESEHGIKIYLHKESGNKLFVMHNTLEDWILKISKANNVNVSDFGLENNSNRMHRLMPGKLNNLRKLIANLIQKEIPQIKYLQSKLRSAD